MNVPRDNTRHDSPAVTIYFATDFEEAESIVPSPDKLVLKLKSSPLTINKWLWDTFQGSYVGELSSFICICEE